MHTEKIAFGEASEASAIFRPSSEESIHLSGFYTVECIGPDGAVKWTDTVENLVTTAGKNFALDTVLGAGTAAAMKLGLIDNASFTAVAAADTMASHAGWIESTVYSNASRPTPSFGSASAASKASTATAFNINASGTITGCFLTDTATKGGATGLLYSAGQFSGGNKVVANLDTLNVTYTGTA